MRDDTDLHKQNSSDHAVPLTHVGLGATETKRILAYGFESAVMEDVGDCNMVVFASIFQYRAILAAYVAESNITVMALAVAVILTRYKGQRARQRLLHL